jgi:hypothetical protein
MDCAIRRASTNGHLETVNLLLVDERVDPSAKDNFALCCASRDGRLKVVKLLLTNSRVDPAANNNSPIRIASQMG